MESETLLRRQIRDLGVILGKVIQEHAGDRVYGREEEIRSLAKSLRRSPDPAQARRLRSLIRGLSPREAYQILSAFTLYFQLVNLAEDLQRNRRRRASLSQDIPQAGSVAELADRLKTGKLSLPKLRQALEACTLGLVLTAHPTEAKRRTVMHKERSISFHLNRLEYESLTPAERAECWTRIRYHVAGLWHTKSSRSRRIDVLDEVHNVLSYFDLTLADALPWLHRSMEEAMSLEAGSLPPFLTLGSWVGGDRDGHPHVTSSLTRKALLEQRKKILKRYKDAVGTLIENMSQSDFLIRLSGPLERSIRKDAEAFAGIGQEPPRWYEETEQLRAKLSYTSRKLARTLEFGPEEVPSLAPGTAYDSPESFLEDLQLLEKSLVQAGLTEEAGGHLVPLIREVQMFGFHLFPLDIRQSAVVIQKAVAELGAGGGLPLSGGGKGEGTSAETRELLATLDTVRWAHDHLGRRSIRAFVVSHAESAQDILDLLSLLKRDKRPPSMDLIPLFESSSSLSRAASIFEDLVTHKAYKPWLRARGSTQEIMLGFSDSNKEAGPLASLTQTHRAERDLASAAKKLGIRLVLFYGRGGTIARGGGRTADALRTRGLPGVGARITEQGEVVSSKYSDTLIARRNLEQVAVAMLLGEIEEEGPPEPPAWLERLESLSVASRRAYRALVYEDPDFLPYFRQATPITEISGLNMGSRPSRRDGGEDVEGLRAIPWVFAWVQNRALLPGWYGLGSALQEAASSDEGLKELQAMAKGWPFFKHALNNFQMSMAKADLQIAGEYAALVGDKKIRARVSDRIQEEYELSRKWVLKISGAKELLDHEPRLQESIKLRNPYVDPLSLIQVELLRRIRRRKLSFETAKTRSDRFLLEGLMLSINGISAGLRNTG